MWPHDFTAWLPSARALAFQRTSDYLSTFPVLTAVHETSRETAQRIALRAVARAELTAREHCLYRLYLADARQFGRWLAELAKREALRLLTEEHLVLTWLGRLSDDQRRILLWLFADHLTLRELTRLLQTSPDRARDAATAASNALVALLPDSARSFPVPPALIGYTV